MHYAGWGERGEATSTDTARPLHTEPMQCPQLHQSYTGQLATEQGTVESMSHGVITNAIVTSPEALPIVE